MKRILGLLIVGLFIILACTESVAEVDFPRKHLRRGGIYDVALASDADVIRGTVAEGAIRIRILEFTNGSWVKVRMVLPGQKEESTSFFWLNFSQVVTVEEPRDVAEEESNRIPELTPSGAGAARD